MKMTELSNLISYTAYRFARNSESPHMDQEDLKQDLYIAALEFGWMEPEVLEEIEFGYARTCLYNKAKKFWNRNSAYTDEWDQSFGSTKIDDDLKFNLLVEDVKDLFADNEFERQFILAKLVGDGLIAEDDYIKEYPDTQYIPQKPTDQEAFLSIGKRAGNNWKLEKVDMRNKIAEYLI